MSDQKIVKCKITGIEYVTFDAQSVKSALDNFHAAALSVGEALSFVNGEKIGFDKEEKSTDIGNQALDNLEKRDRERRRE